MEGSSLPRPPHPHQRREPLPWQAPKPPDEDAQASARVEALMRSPSYRLAEEDVDYLQSDATRGVRLLVDYQKTEDLLRRRGIEHTIVVFGGSRIREAGGAERRVRELRAALERGDDPEVRARLARAERLRENAVYYREAREFGRLVGEFSRSTGARVVVVTGGGPGVMEAANRGAYDAGAETIGLNIDLPHEQFPNPYITPELCLRFHYFAVRKLHFMLRAKALVAFPGGYGTLDELFEVLTLVQTRKTPPIPVVLVCESFWRRLIDFPFLLEQGLIDAEDHELFGYAESGEEAWESILDWHRANGTPLDGVGNGQPAGGPGGAGGAA